MEYEVGKYYDVVCMEHYNIDNKDEKIFVPIFNLYHKDAQFGADFFHYHIDGRFTDKKINSIFNIIDGYTNSVVDNKTRCYYTPIRKVIKLKKCKRLTTGLVPPIKAERFWNWYRSMEGKSCAGKKCPHLGTEMLERGGALICPLHNLMGDIKTEKIIKAS